MTRAIVMALTLAAATSCTTTGMTPSLTVTTLMPDSERWFRLSWEATPEKSNSDLRRLRGYVENTYGEAASRVQLLAQAIDTSGALVGQKLWWVSGVVPGFGRTYFEIPDMPKAETYRVTVWAYERIQGRDGFVIQR